MSVDPAVRRRAAPSAAIEYAPIEPPAPGRVAAVAPGVHWLRMPLPFALDHINLWLLEDGAGWSAVDTGIGLAQTRALWRELFRGAMGGRELRRLLVTHFHPDHFGLAGWLHRERGAPLWMTRAEWLTGSLIHADAGGALAAAQIELFREHGLQGQRLEALAAGGNRYRRLVSTPPRRYRRLRDGEELQIGAQRWRVLVGTGHAPELACLYCARLGVLIAGDQVLPAITPNVSLSATEPEANPLALFLETAERLRALPAETLVLPSHGRPFRGLHARLAQFRDHHAQRLDALREACAEPRSAAELLPLLFRRRLDTHQVMFAMGESLAHLRWLEAAGALRRRRDAAGVVRFRRARGG